MHLAMESLSGVSSIAVCSQPWVCKIAPVLLAAEDDEDKSSDKSRIQKCYFNSIKSSLGQQTQVGGTNREGSKPPLSGVRFINTLRFDLGLSLADGWRHQNCCAALIEGFLSSLVPDRIVGGLLLTPKIRLQLEVHARGPKLQTRTMEARFVDMSAQLANGLSASCSNGTGRSLSLTCSSKLCLIPTANTCLRKLLLIYSCLLSECVSNEFLRVNTDALAKQWNSKCLQSRAYMQGPTPQQIKRSNGKNEKNMVHHTSKCNMPTLSSSRRTKGFFERVATARPAGRGGCTTRLTSRTQSKVKLFRSVPAPALLYGLG